MNKTGRRKMLASKRRRNIRTTVAVETEEFLNDQPESLGRTIDMLVQHYIDDLLDDVDYNANCVKLEVGGIIRYHDGEEWQSTVITELKEEE